MKILTTGAAGFIGYHAVKKFVLNGDSVMGLDSINSYYSVKLKEARLSELGIDPSIVSYGKAFLL